MHGGNISSLQHLSMIFQRTGLYYADFSENYTCLYQDGAQSAHWSHDQATLFSEVAYYRCKDCSEIVTESFSFVSDVKRHDCQAVHHFVPYQMIVCLSQEKIQ